MGGRKGVMEDGKGGREEGRKEVNYERREKILRLKKRETNWKKLVKVR